MKSLNININGQKFPAASDQTVAGVMLENDIHHFRTSLTGEPRAALCGMGICQECRVSINGKSNERACMITCKDGMDIQCG